MRLSLRGAIATVSIGLVVGAIGMLFVFWSDTAIILASLAVLLGDIGLAIILVEGKRI